MSLFSEEVHVGLRIFNATTIGMIVVFVAMFGFSFAYKDNNLTRMVLTIAVLTTLFAMVMANRYNKQDLITFIIIVIVDFFCLPVLHFYAGGLSGTMPAWEMMGVLLICFLMESRISYILGTIYLADFSLVYYLTIKYPQLVKNYVWANSDGFEVFVSFILVSGWVSLIYIYQKNLYIRQGLKLEEKEKNAVEAMKKYEKASNAKTDFLANMSHEIRTPINAIMGMNEMILRESESENITEYASNVENASESLLSLVNDILDYSKIEAEAFTLEPVEFSTKKLLGDCFNLLKARADEKHLSLTVKNNAFLPSRIKGDEVRLRQVIVNLLTNAIKYTTVGSVSLFADFNHREDGRIDLKISVTDTGIGIKKEDYEKLFIPFERVDRKVNRNIEGTGLGLMLVKRYVELFGGTISVESEYGKGSTFSVSVPVIICDSTPVGNLSDNLFLKGTNQKKYESSLFAPNAKILSVDDVKLNHDVIISLLKPTEVNIDTVYNGREAINMIKAGHYDLILMDHLMPEMDGIQTLFELKKLECAKNIPVVILTANALSGAREDYLEKGFSDFLAKPVKGVELEEILIKHLPEKLIETSPHQTKEPKEKKMNEKEITEDVFRRFDYLNLDSALECCADSLELYVQILSGFLYKDYKYDALNDYFEKKDFDNYKVLIHAVKSSSLLVGLNELSEKAKALEFAIKDGNTDYVLLHHKEVMDEYKSVSDVLRSTLSEYGIEE